MAKDKDHSREAAAPAPAPPEGGPQLRLVDRRAFVGFPSLQVSPGLAIADFGLQIPDVSFPFNLSGGPSRYQRKTLQFGFLELHVDAELIARKVAEISARLPELTDLKLHFRPSYLEGQARLKTAEKTPFTFKLAFDGDGEKLAVYIYDVRLYGFCATPASQLTVSLSKMVGELQILPDVELRGATGFTTRLLPELCQMAAVSRGYKLPTLDTARLSVAEISAKGLKLRFSSGGLPPPAPPDEELLLALEGARAFGDAEAMVGQGKLAQAREAYLKLGDATEAHPFAAERLLTLLVADPQAHELALDVAASLQRRREKSSTALWAEAVVRERRGEHARAAERYLALCSHARKASDDASAFFAAEAAARAAKDHAPQMAVRALHELLGLKPDHLPSLQQLAKSSDQAKDRAGAIRAYRRIAALARDPAEAADAHVHMARLCTETEDDVAGARLHCEAALKLQPEHPEALYHLSELCHRAGEHLRALKSVDRLREVALARHEIERIGRANVLAGRIWEEGLKQAENALLRYREAVSLMPAEPEPHFLAARVAESLGRHQESVAGYQQAVELAGPQPKTEEIRKAAHAAHHALSRLYRTRLGDAAKAKEHLEAALALDPRDMVALEELIPYFRAAGRAAELADACEKAAAVADDPVRRAAFWSEAGELYRARLNQPEKAEKLLVAALEADDKNRIALEALLGLAESRRDGGQLCRCLKGLAELSVEPKERVRYYRRLAVAARDLTFDLDLATLALIEVLKLEPEDLASIGELCGLQRRRADMPGLANALELRARVAEAQSDRRLSAAALRELAQVLELRLGRIGDALVALEKAARLSPEPSILFDLADLSIRCDRPDHARTALTELLSSLPKHAAPERLAEVYARLGRACDLLGDRDAARDHYGKAFPLRRLDDELAARLEILHRDANDHRALAEMWAERAQAFLAAGRPDAAAPLYLHSAQALLELKESPAALVRLSAALDANPEGDHAAEILELMSATELEHGNRIEAAKLLARRAGLYQEPRPAAKLLIRAAELADGTAREESYLSQAVQKDGSLAVARLKRAKLALETNAWAALQDLEAALQPKPGDPDPISAADRLDAARLAATAATRSNQAEAARRHLGYFVSQRPSDLEAQLELAELHRRAQDREALCDLLGDLWHRLAGPTQQSSLREYAELSIELGRPAAANDALRSLLERDRTNAWAARMLLKLLPKAPASATEARERMDLIGVLIGASQGAERARLLEDRSELYRSQGALAEARADLQEAASIPEAPRELLRKVAELAQQAGDEVGELSAWKEAVARDPSLADVAGPRLLALSRGRLLANDFHAARGGFAACAMLALPAAELCEAQFGLGETLVCLADSANAAEAFKEAAKQGPPRRRFEALMRRAQLLETDGEGEQAAAALKEALELTPRHQAATAQLKRVLTNLADWEALAALLSEELAAAPKPQVGALAFELGKLYADRLSMPVPAEAAFRRAAQADKSNVEARRLLADLLLEKGEVKEAVALLEEAADALPAAQAATLLLAGAKSADGADEPELAVQLTKRSLQLKAPEGEELFAAAKLLYARGAPEEALPLYERLFANADFAGTPERAEEVGLHLADLAAKSDEPGLAERTLRRVIKERPLFQPAVERLSSMLQPKSPREALGLLFEHAQQRGPSDETARYLIDLATRAKSELADPELTAEMLSLAVTMARDPLAVRQQLAALYRDAGRTTELGEQLVAVAELSREEGDLPDAIRAYEELAGLQETSGRLDESLKTLATVRELWVAEKDKPSAAAVERRRADLFAQKRMDLDAAAEAFERSHALNASAATCRAALALAMRREDAGSQATWLERLVPLAQFGPLRAEVQLQLAQLYDKALSQKDKAEQAAKDALDSAPSFIDAQKFLEALYERDDRVVELAQLHEDLASRETDPTAKAARFKEAARLYEVRAKRPEAAAAALLAARASTPDDVELTSRIAALLHKAGRGAEGAEFDAVLLRMDPFAEPSYKRHRAHLEEEGNHEALAALLVKRGEARTGKESAEALLEAAEVYREAGAEEKAARCEVGAFQRAPEHDRAFKIARERASGDVRQLSEVLHDRAAAVGAKESIKLLRERADALLKAGEELLASEAFDDLLAVAREDVQALSQRADLAAHSGGPLASQPYDRRLLQAGGKSLAAPLRLKTQLRLGHAALSAGAYQDATDAFEDVVVLDADGEKGREALSLLTEVHAKTGNNAGLFRTTLQLAKGASGEEAEAMLRRAAELFEAPADAAEALIPLAKLRPSDERVVARAAEALRGLGRYGDLLELYEKSADSIGGKKAADLLLQAAAMVEAELQDDARAFELRRRAGEIDPDNTEALGAVADEQRRRKDHAGLAKTLAKMAAATRDLETGSTLRLELADAAAAAGEEEVARTALRELFVAGPKAHGYRQAVERLATLLAKTEEHGELAEVLEARAQLASGEEQARFLILAARAAKEAGDGAKAATLSHRSAELFPNVETLAFSAQAWFELGERARQGRALVRAAELSPEQARGAVLVEAAEAFEAAGAKEEACALLERVATDFPKLISAEAAADRLLAMGQAEKAMQLGFDSALKAGRFDRALFLADSARDAGRAEEAMWGLVEGGGFQVDLVNRLASELRRRAEGEGLLRLAAAAEKPRAELAATLYEEVALGEHGPAIRKIALQRIDALGQSARVVAAALERDLANEDLAVVDVLLDQARAVGGTLWVTALDKVSRAVPARRKALLRERVDLDREQAQAGEAAGSLQALIAVEDDPKARAALEVELGELWLKAGGAEAKARESFEAALSHDASSVAAARHLLSLGRPNEAADRFIVLAEQVRSAEGDEVIAPHRARLAEAYAQLGKRDLALAELAKLPETPELLNRRAHLLGELGRVGESLALRERAARTPEELEQVLFGYLEANLVLPAVALSERLLAESITPSPVTHRMLAERFSGDPDGAALAARIWPALLEKNLFDADAWTLFAEALKLSGKPQQAQLVDGFGAALTGSEASPPMANISALVSFPPSFAHPTPEGLVRLTAEAMPRLHGALQPALASLAASSVEIWLDPAGGVEAYLLRPTMLVLGVGALSCFGSSELVYLMTLGLALGERGLALRRPGAVEGLARAAEEAFASVPASLAASRVIAQLDPLVRGGDPTKVDVSAVLAQSDAFVAIARKALNIL